MWYHLVDAFSAWFFVSLFVVFIIEITLAETESPPGWGFFWLIGWLGAAVLFSDFRPWVWPIEHWLLSVLIVIIYVAAGIAWSVVKWSWHVAEKVKAGTAAEYLNPARHENKGRIVTWMMWWPFSMLWWLLRWPRQVFNALYDRLSGVFRRIVERAYAVEK